MAENENLKNKREITGIIACIFALVCDVALAASKLVIGFMFQSVAVIADGLNNATDSASALMTLFSFKFASRPADREHPFGHQRMEYIVTLVIAVLIFFVALEVIKSSIEKIVYGSIPEASTLIYIVLGASIAVKGLLGVSFMAVSKKIGSAPLKATAIDSFSDVLTTSAVAVSSILFQTTGVNLDAYFGIGVAVMIILSGIKILKEVINPLLGEPPSSALVQRIDDRIKSYDGVLGLHDLLIHSYGPDKHFASVHVEVDGDMDTNITHELADRIEKEIKLDEHVDLVVHIDPHSLYENGNHDDDD